MVVATRQEFIDYCLRELGHPVIEINVDDDQVEDRVDEALQYYQQFHYDGTEKTYLRHQVTATDITNRYITVSEDVIGISRVFPLDPSYRTNMFDINYQMRLHDLQTYQATSYVNYEITMQHLRMLDMIFVGEVPIRFNRHTDRLYIDWDWGVKVLEGDWIVAEAFVIVDPTTYTDVWNDRMLKQYATALIKRQWGSNLSKYSGIQLTGGTTLNGDKIFQDADQRVKELEAEIRAMYEAPPMFLVG